MIEPPEPGIDEAHAERRIAASRGDFAALVAKADHRLRAGDRRAANAGYRAAHRGDEVGRAERVLATLVDYFTQHTLEPLDAGRRARSPRAYLRHLAAPIEPDERAQLRALFAAVDSA